MLYAWEISKTGRQSGHPAGAEQSWQHTRHSIGNLLQNLGVEPGDNLHKWVIETLVHCDDRDLGMLMQLCKRITQRLC